jgi:membrane-associated protein
MFDHILQFAQAHSILVYLVIFAVGIFEGPMLTALCGFLVTRGLLDLFLVYGIVVLGDMVGDTLHYALGRFGSNQLLSFMKITSEKLEVAKRNFQTRNLTMISLSKLIHGVGVLGLVYAGVIRAPYRRYVLGCLTITLGQSLVLLLLGVSVGSMYMKVSAYLNIYAAIVSALAVAGIAFWSFQKSLIKVPGFFLGKAK